MEHSQLQLLLLGCEPRRATRCWGLEELLLPAEQGRMAQIFWQPPDGDTQDAGAHSRSWKASRDDGCKSLCLLCISSLFQISVFAWLVLIYTIQVHFPRLSPLLYAAPGFPPLHCCLVPLSLHSPSVNVALVITHGGRCVSLCCRQCCKGTSSSGWGWKELPRSG